MNRKNFLKISGLGSLATLLDVKTSAQPTIAETKPIVISTWDAGISANKGAWKVLYNGGKALDAVEQGVRVTESEISCCVGLNANPDRDGIVTLDASIMDHEFNCGGVAFLERIKHPISVARKVMEKTPHVLLVGSGAQQFAVAEGFPLEPQKLSAEAQKAYDNWLKNSRYEPQINRETKGHGPFAPEMIDGKWNHDTIGMLALDVNGLLAGSCTTSGMGFKMRGRVGDSPIIGAGLFVDGEAGACVATGQGEDVIRVAGSHSVVALLRQGYEPENACKEVIERIVKIKKENAKKIQVAFIALTPQGTIGAFAIQPGFSYAVKSGNQEELLPAKSYFN